MAEWYDARGFTDHWTWRPEWTETRPRILWYLTFGDSPGVEAAASAVRGQLTGTGADVVPPRWLHLTVTDTGFPEDIDPWALRLGTEEVRRALLAWPSFELSLGPVNVLPEAVVLAAGPHEPVRRLRRTIRQGLAMAGIRPPVELDREPPHVSLCYVNDRTDHGRLRRVVPHLECSPVRVRCDRVAQVLVTRSHGHYHWEVLDEMRLTGPPALTSSPRSPREVWAGRR